MNRAVEFKNVSFSYGENYDFVLKNSDFFLEYGEVSLLAGFSGSGKSTVLSILTGIIPNLTGGNLKGSVFVDGQDISGKKINSICKKVALVMQNAEIQIIHDTVEDEIAFGMENFAFEKHKMEEQIEKSCKMLNLERQWQTRTLSGGQKQRLITASALSTEQKIILLDEPLANLDTDGTLLLMKTLKTLSRKGYAVLIVEHRLDELMEYVDSVWNISGKKLVKINDKEKFLSEQTVFIKDICKKNTENVAMEILFSLKNVKYSVNGREILKDISFDIKKGERVVLCGQNGCGKTTLLRLIARLADCSGGQILQNLDKKLGQKQKMSSRIKNKWFKKVGVVYQNPNYQLFMPTVLEEIEFACFSKEYAKKIIGLFALEPILSRHPQSLSEGQKRRVSIAAVLACRPEVLILDEPTVGQDYEGLCSLTDILNKIHEETKNTMILVTHDKRCINALCDHKIFIEKGIFF